MQLKEHTSANRILVVDDDALLIGEYLRCLGDDFEPDAATATLGDLEKVLFGESTDERGAVRFEVDARRQGEAAVEAVRESIEAQTPFAIVFIDIRMPPGMDGIEAAKQIRALDSNVNIVVVTGSASPEPEDLGRAIPPADKVFFFKKPFHSVECRQLAAALCGKWHAVRALRRANEELERRVEHRTEALTKLAYFDPVTRLPNKLLLHEQLQGMLERAEDETGDTAVILLDIDRFSFINETMGYEAGTELLRSVGNRMQRDFVEERLGQRAVVGRFGGDELALLAPGIDSEEEIHELAKRLRDTIEEPFLINGRDLFLKTAIGVAWYPIHGRDAKTVIRSAEAALHRSKRSLDNATTYYHSEMRYRARHRFDLEAELRAAIDAGQIGAHYQPQQAIADGSMSGVEALARWTRPDGSIALPGEFIPLGEEMGISDVLFETVLRQVCRDVNDWRDAGDWSAPVSVNLSAHQLRNKNLVTLIREVLADENVDRELINLELTETVILEDISTAVPILYDLAALGVGIHIDDFGTGYSSLSYLAQLPVKTLKIDQSFVTKLSDKKDANRRVVEAIVALAKALRLEVVAEGIETDKQYAIARRLKVDLAQGFFIARPMPADALLNWQQGYVDTQNVGKRPTVVELTTRKT